MKYFFNGFPVFVISIIDIVGLTHYFDGFPTIPTSPERVPIRPLVYGTPHLIQGQTIGRTW